MVESQNIEYKSIWKDEYLKWICGFANATGGTIFIGKEDGGKVVGLPNTKKLLEDIPNKVRDILGIIVDVNLYDEDGKDYVEIRVESHPYPVSYKGQYHYRSGSTKQELKGAALDRFMIQKQGKRWDGISIPSVTLKDLNSEAIELFKNKASRSGRLSDDALKNTTDVLMHNLRLKDGDYFKRAAILLFHSDPEKYVTGAYIKIGFFESVSELRYQDEIHGNLIGQADKAMDLLLTKYLKAYVSYEGINRIEQFLFPKEALREALLNAIVHKDYTGANPIQIRVYEDRIIIWNDGELPENWTIETLKKSHPSKPFNPDVANVFFRAGLIESWGRGIEKIEKECIEHGLSTPEFEYDASSFKFIIHAESLLEKIKHTSPTEIEKLSGKTSGKTSGKILTYITDNKHITIPELAQLIGVTERSIERNIQKLQKQSKLKRYGGSKGGYWQIIL